MKNHLGFSYRQSSRLRGRDYSRGSYAVTICVRERECLFGEVAGNQMKLNERGLIAHDTWRLLKEQFEHVVLDEFVIMPNHMHGIIRFVNGEDGDADTPANIVKNDPVKAKRCGGFSGRKNPMVLENSLSTLIRWYKGRCSYEIRRRDAEISFYWQRGFYEQVITNMKVMAQKRNYIKNNPANWETDELHPLNRHQRN